MPKILIPPEQRVDSLFDQAVDFVITVTYENGDPVPLVGVGIDFAFSNSRRTPGSDSLPVTFEDNVISVRLTSEQNRALGTGSHYFSCWVTVSGESTPVALGWLNILSSTRT